MPFEPCDDIVAQLHRQGSHSLSVGVGHKPDALVPANIPLLAERVEGRHHLRVCTNRLAQRLDGALVMGLARGSIARRGKCCRRRLQAGVVSDVHPPVGAETFSGAVGEVAFDDLQQVADFVSAGLMPYQPAVSLPVLQAHRLLR